MHPRGQVDSNPSHPQSLITPAILSHSAPGPSKLTFAATISTQFEAGVLRHACPGTHQLMIWGSYWVQEGAHQLMFVGVTGSSYI